MTVKSSTSITASWQLPPEGDRNGVITGFKLFYKKKGSSGSQNVSRVNSGSTQNKVVTGLDEHTEYEFQVLAYTSVGDGPKSSVKYETTMEDGKLEKLDTLLQPIIFIVTAREKKNVYNPSNLFTRARLV